MKKKTEVVLLKDVNKLGKKNQVVKVALGYARNYILPQGVGMLNNVAGKNYVNAKLSAKERQLKKIDSMKDQILSSLLKNNLVFERKISKKGTLYGSVTVSDIVNVIKSTVGVKIIDSMVVLPDHIKTVGEYTYTIVFSPENKVDFKMQVKPIVD